MKRTAYSFLIAFILLFICGVNALAASAVSLVVTPSKVLAGAPIAVGGTAAAHELLSIKVTDEDGNIVYYSAVRAGLDGTYEDTFHAPDTAPQTLTVVAGNGNDTASAQVEIYVQYTVAFDNNGGDANADPVTMTVPEGELVTRPTAPKRSGYTFGGWYKEAGCNNAWNFDADTVSKNLTLYAKWNIKTYTVKFFQADGTTQIGATQMVNWGMAAKVETAPSISGYTFDKWMLTGDDTTETTTLKSVKENIKAVASYTENGVSPTTQPGETASKEPTATPSATLTPSAMPAPSNTPVPLATPVPATPVPATPVQREDTPDTSDGTAQVVTMSPSIIEDEKNSTVIVEIIVSDLPAGTTSIKLPNGDIIEIGNRDTIQVEILQEHIDENGSMSVVALNEEGDPLATVELEATSEMIALPSSADAWSGIWSVLKWILIGLAGLGLVIFAVYIIFRNRKND